MREGGSIRAGKAQGPHLRVLPSRQARSASVEFKRERASTFIIVLWIAFGLVSITLYFAHAMSIELRAADNRLSGVSAEQAIEGAARYVTHVLGTQIANGSNGLIPDATTQLSEAVAVGDAHFWLIGRDTNNITGQSQIFFGLVDEASKLNLNTASSNMLVSILATLPRANQDLAAAILDWRDTNGGGAFQTYYAMQRPPYETKSGPFETVDELRLVSGGTLDTLVGEDVNRNGILDPNEDVNRDGRLDPGMLEYVTVYSREPSTYSNGVARINLSGSTKQQITSVLQQTFGFTAERAGAIGNNLSPGPAITPLNFTSPLQFYMRSRMTADEFAKIANAIKVNNSTNYIEGRINVNTASAAVLSCLPGLSTTTDLAQTLVNYRQTNPDKLTSIAWIVDALGQNNNTVLQALAAVDCLTTQSFQFSGDVAALGPHNRGYRRVRFVFDTSDGTPRIVYRQDLTSLGWAMGKDVREKWLFAKETR